MHRSRLDLVGATGLALATVVVVLVGAPVAFTSLLGIPLVLLAPGYVWQEVFFGATLRAEVRTLLSVAFSLTITALGGILLAVVHVRLDRSSWLIILVGTTLAGAAGAAIRGARPSAIAPVRFRVPRAIQAMSVLQGVRFTTSILLGAAAIAVALHSANTQVHTNYTQLSIDQGGGAPRTALVLLGNHEAGVQHYRVVLSSDSVATQVWRITVAEGADWARSVPARAGHRLAVDVYRSDDGQPYRHVAINVPRVGAP